MLERKKLLMEYGFRALMEQIPPGTVSTKVQDSIYGREKGPKRTGVYVNPGHPGYFTQGEDGTKTAYTVHDVGPDSEFAIAPPETQFMPIPLKRPKPEKYTKLDEEMPPIPSKRPEAPKGSGYVPASSTGGIKPAPIKTGTKGTVMAKQNAVRVDADGNPVPPLEAMGLKIPAQRPTGSEVPEYPRSGIRGVIQSILGR